jgi:hypothetical protein
MSVIQARLSDSESKVIRDYARAKKISVSSLIRESVLEKIEDEIDLRIYKKAMAEFRKNPKTYSLDEVIEELGLSNGI